METGMIIDSYSYSFEKSKNHEITNNMLFGD